MNQIILSIKPRFAEAILQGKKRCEFRRSTFPKGIGLVIIYSSKPVGKIVGWFIVKNFRIGKPKDLWHSHESDGGVSKEEFDEYYKGERTGVCLEIKCVHRLDPPLDPFVRLNKFTVPQSFRYLVEEENSLFSRMIKDSHCPDLEFYYDETALMKR